jgi:acetyl esterase/lipase
MSRTRLLLDVVKPRRSYRYGSEHRCQRADLSLPRGRGPHPVVVTIHGGSWAAGYTKLVMRGVVGDLVRWGFAVWNIEEPLDLERVTLLGHSAGATLALWAGGRGSLPDGAPGARPLIMPVAVVAQAAPADLATIYEESGGGAVGWLMGGSPERYPERYALADPIARVPLPVPVLLVHGTDDRLVAVRRSRNYAAAARAAGGVVELVELAGEAGGHRQHVNPDSAAWEVVRAWLAGQLRGSRAGG